MKKLPFTIDARDLDVNDRTLDILFMNNPIEFFLNSESSSCVSSAKGFGKTFLLKIKKRNVLNEKSSITLIPQNADLDTIPGIPDDKSLIGKLADYNNWVTLWKLSISLAVVKSEYERSKKSNNVFYETIKSTLSNDLLDILNSDYDTPCKILSHILYFDNHKFSEIIKNAPRATTALSFVNNPYAVFIDSIDEAFGFTIYTTIHDKKFTDMWYFAQYSILEAIVSLEQTNKHIKVYCGIRQEAYKNRHLCPTQLHQQISGLITEIEYNNFDLKEMFDLYVDRIDSSYLLRQEYLSTNKAYALFGYETIDNTFVGVKEPTFDYIYRHSLKRPRDIMQICRDICIRRPRNNDPIFFKRIVDRSAKNIVENYLSQIDPFAGSMDCSGIEIFLNNLNTSIFTKDKLSDICKEYGDKQMCPNGECGKCDKIYPFFALYNVGLLGYVKEDFLGSNNNDNGQPVARKMQTFLPPGNCSYTAKNATLPKSKLYFLHPAASDFLQSEDHGFDLCKSFVIGDSLEITDNDISKAIKEINDKCQETVNS